MLNSHLRQQLLPADKHSCGAADAFFPPSGGVYAHMSDLFTGKKNQTPKKKMQQRKSPNISLFICTHIKKLLPFFSEHSEGKG